MPIQPFNFSLKDFGGDFFGGAYRHYTIRFGVHLVRMADNSTNGSS